MKCLSHKHFCCHSSLSHITQWDTLLQNTCTHLHTLPQSCHLSQVAFSGWEGNWKENKGKETVRENSCVFTVVLANLMWQSEVGASGHHNASDSTHLTSSLDVGVCAKGLFDKTNHLQVLSLFKNTVLGIECSEVRGSNHLPKCYFHCSNSNRRLQTGQHSQNQRKQNWRKASACLKWMIAFPLFHSLTSQSMVARRISG